MATPTPTPAPTPTPTHITAAQLVSDYASARHLAQAQYEDGRQWRITGTVGMASEFAESSDWYVILDLPQTRAGLLGEEGVVMVYYGSSMHMEPPRAVVGQEFTAECTIYGVSSLVKDGLWRIDCLAVPEGFTVRAFTPPSADLDVGSLLTAAATSASTPTPTPAPTPTHTPTPGPTATPTPASTPLQLDFTPVIASEEAWDCFAGRDLPIYWDRQQDPDNIRLWTTDEDETLCGWDKAFKEEEKRPDTLYYRTRGGSWDESQMLALSDVLTEVSDLSGILILPEDEAQLSGPARDRSSVSREFAELVWNTLTVGLWDDPNNCQGDRVLGCATYEEAERWGPINFNDPWGPLSTYPASPRVDLIAGRIGDDQLFRHVLRHEVMHAVFGFLHSWTPFLILHTNSYSDRVDSHERAREHGTSSNPGMLQTIGETPGEFSGDDKEMLRLYGDIPHGMEWEEIQRRACVGDRASGLCFRMYEWREEPWWDPAWY